MSLCHLYFQHSISHHAQEILDTFDNSISLDIDKISGLDDYDTYIIELQEANQTISSTLRQLFKEKPNSLIYFIVPKKHDLKFFQLTYLLNAKHLITQSIETQKVIKKIVEDQKSHKKETLTFLVGNAAIQIKSFMLYKNMQLEEVSSQLLEDFKCKTFQSFQANILSKLEIQTLLEKDGVIEKSILLNSTVSQNYTATSLSVANNKKIIFIELSSQQTNQLDFISSRVTFIELLKEKLLAKNIIDNELSAITINIQNIKRLQEELTILDLENLLIDFLDFVESTLDKIVIFAQIEINYYVILFENIQYKEINDIAKNLNTQIIHYISTQKYKPLIDIYTVNLGTLEFSDIISTFTNIKNKELSQEKSNSIDIKHINNTQNIITEKNLLDDAFKRSIKIKILNIYHGLVINTPSKILKITKEYIYIRFDSLQGVVINIEKRTVLQSPVFLQDIEATVKKIDLTKKIAILENFKFLKTNANSRKYSRVTTSTKTPISMLVNGATVNGYILDLSIKSIAIKIKYTPLIDTIKTDIISLAFNIPNLKSNVGFSRLNIKAKVILVTLKDTHDMCKIICDIDEDYMNDSILMQYIYERQKELIIELKKTAQLH